MKKMFRWAAVAVIAGYALVCDAEPVFSPYVTATISASTTSANKAVWQSSPQVVIHNATSVTVFIKFGTDDSVAATTADYPILAGATETLTKRDASYVAAITASGSGSVYVTSGTGE